MLNGLRYRYSQFFVLSMGCAFIYVMVQSIGPGVTIFQQNFYKKDYLIGNSNLLRMKIGDRVFSAALLEKDGWMIYPGDSALNSFQEIKNKKDIVKDLKTLNRYLKSQNITLLIVVAPDKSTIYQDKLSRQIKLSLPTQSRLDRFISYLYDNNLPIVDLRPDLHAARKYHDVFYKTDSHWNGYGAYIAYRTIINALRSSHPELKPYETTDLELVTTSPVILDGPRNMGVTTITEPGFFFLRKEDLVQTLHPVNYFGYNQFSSIEDSTLPTLIMFHDSFGIMYLNDYLSMNFGKSHFFHHQLDMPYLTKESIEQFKPDIVIIEIVERDLEKFDGLLVHWKSP